MMEYEDLVEMDDRGKQKLDHKEDVKQTVDKGDHDGLENNRKQNNMACIKHWVPLIALGLSLIALAISVAGIVTLLMTAEKNNPSTMKSMKRQKNEHKTFRKEIQEMVNEILSNHKHSDAVCNDVADNHNFIKNFQNMVKELNISSNHQVQGLHKMINSLNSTVKHLQESLGKMENIDDRMEIIGDSKTDELMNKLEALEDQFNREVKIQINNNTEELSNNQNALKRNHLDTIDKIEALERNLTELSVVMTSTHCLEDLNVTRNKCQPAHSDCNITLLSIGHIDPGYSYYAGIININGVKYNYKDFAEGTGEYSTFHRGISIVILSESCQVIRRVRYDTWKSSAAGEAFNTLLSSLDDGTVVAGICVDDCDGNMGEAAKSNLQSNFGVPPPPGWQTTLAFVAKKGSPEKAKYKRNARGSGPSSLEATYPR